MDRIAGAQSAEQSVGFHSSGKSQNRDERAACSPGRLCFRDEGSAYHFTEQEGYGLFTYEEAVQYIEDIPKFTTKNKLEHTRQCLDLLGSPDKGKKIIHVAGTNGKGSVCAFISTMLEEGGGNLSGGQRQRLCIARTLLKKPKVLIFDDSTSAVDTATEGKIRQALLALPETTKLIIAQRITSVMHADQIIILEDGRIHAVGDHPSLLASDPVYQEIYASQMKGGMEDGAN